VRGAS